MRSLDPNYDLNWDLVAFERATVRRHDFIDRCRFFGVVHDQRNYPAASTGGPFTSLHLNGHEQIWNTTKMISFPSL